MPLQDFVDDLSGNETLKMDLYGGSVQVGLQNDARTRVLRRGRVANLDETETSKKNLLAAAVVLQSEGTSHPDDLLLPLDIIRASSFGPKKSIVEAEYRPARFGQFNDNHFTRAQVRATWESVRVYKTSTNADDPDTPVFDANGLPNGDGLEGVEDDQQLHDPERPPLGKRFRRVVVKVAVSAELTFHPLAFPFIATAIGTINSNLVTFSQAFVLPGQYGPGSVRFDGVDVRVIIRQNGLPSFLTQYLFSIVNGRWFEQRLQPFGFNGNEFWEVETQPMYDISAFPIFPLGGLT